MHKFRIHAVALFAAAVAVVAASPSYAADTQAWSLGISAGASYDDNVNVSALDVKAGKGDTITNLGLDAGYKLVDDKTNKLSFNYDFSQSLHASLKKFDIQSHELGFSGTTNWDGATLGLSYSFYHLLLGGSSFLDMHVVNPSVSGFIAPHLYLRASYFYYGKSFYTFVARDASHHEPHVTLFYFFNRAKSYISLDAQYQIENTTGAEYDYKGYAFTASVLQPVDLGFTTVKVKAGYTYLRLDYDNITPSIGVRRYETRSTLHASADIPLSDSLAFTLEDRYMNRNSNLLSTKYTENVISGTLHYRF
jgi:hypothetical protein